MGVKPNRGCALLDRVRPGRLIDAGLKLGETLNALALAKFALRSAQFQHFEAGGLYSNYLLRCA